MLSYWLNGRMLGTSPAGYHWVNLAIHLLNSGLVFLVLRKLVRNHGAAALGAAIFLVHPLQTESVSYIAGRSESLAALFVLAAYVVFLYRRSEEISWRESTAVVALFGLGVATKENAVALAGVLLLTDLLGGGVRRNRRLYFLMLPVALAAAAAVFRMLSTAGTAGFSAATYRWYEYGFTEARAVFVYLRMALLPVGQSLDHDFAASRTVWQHGAIYYLAALCGLIAAAVWGRRRFPLASLGVLMFLMWLAPTSSIVPIDDALVERRMYLPLMGLILAGCELAGRWRLRAPALWGGATVLLLALSGYCHERNRLWGNPETLVAQAAEKATHNPRPLLNVAEILMRRNRCDLAAPYLIRAQRILPGNYFVMAAWGRTLACLGRTGEALAVLTEAARLRPCSQVYEWLGLVYGQMGMLAEAGGAIQRAVEMDPRSAEAHSALAFWYESRSDWQAAEVEYRKSLELDPQLQTARQALERLQRLKADSHSQDTSPNGSD
jgi:hypothetical protein